MANDTASPAKTAVRLSLSLKINEIFYSLQGESSRVGLPTIFIRLTGCPLRCQYCDTEYAFYEGKKLSIEQILHDISQYDCRYITVTGGEPLAQKHCNELLNVLCDNGYHVSLETSGAIDIANVDTRVMKVVDLKTPASKEAEKNRYENLMHLKPDDEIKFVICDHADYVWAKKMIDDHKLVQICPVLFSASHEQLSDTTLADWILQDQLPVRFQTQLHKALWTDSKGR